jgi:prepilin-type N-terminal cleavage/methylation domain-containing protein
LRIGKVKKIRMQRNGFSLAEVAIAIALGALVITVSIPAFMEVRERALHDAAVRKVVGEIHEARARAIATGWEFRVLGYDKDTSHARRNQMRVIGRRSGTVAWPGEEDPNVNSKFAASWINVPVQFKGILLDANVVNFVLTFDQRGAAPGAAAFSPLRVVDGDGRQSTITVSVVGGVRIQ